MNKGGASGSEEIKGGKGTWPKFEVAGRKCLPIGKTSI